MEPALYSAKNNSFSLTMANTNTGHLTILNSLNVVKFIRFPAKEYQQHAGGQETN